jgi:hypothetical protein
MTSNASPDGTDADSTADAGSSTDQHVTGSPETGTFLTDQAPTAGTPAHGSGNAGVDTAGAHLPDDDTGEPG